MEQACETLLKAIKLKRMLNGFDLYSQGALSCQ